MIERAFRLSCSFSELHLELSSESLARVGAQFIVHRPLLLLMGKFYIKRKSDDDEEGKRLKQQQRKLFE